MGSQEEVEAYLHWDEGPCYAIEKINSDEQSIGLRPEDLTNLVENLENLEIAVESENARKLKSNQF